MASVKHKPAKPAAPDAARPLHPKRAVIAFGGNALIGKGEQGWHHEQLRNAIQTVRVIAQLVNKGHQLVIVHGNGPQVGLEMMLVEEGSNQVPPVPLDVCVAKTQGTMAYILQEAFRNHFAKHRSRRDVAALITEVVVDAGDPAFGEPTKPVGPFFNAVQAARLRKERKWTMREDAGRGFRKVVPSPRPIAVANLEAVTALLDAGMVVVAGGGGGIPVTRSARGRRRGVEAVIDKDFTAALIAREIGASLLVIVSAVECVAVNFGKPDERKLYTVSDTEMRRFQAAGQFPPGSMGPKVEAALDFIQHGGSQCVITDGRHIREALRGATGTRIVRGLPQQNLFDD